MKRISIITGLVVAVAIAFTACQDKFTDKDYLNLSSNLKLQQDSLKLKQQVAALNDAGELLSFTVQVVDDHTPVQGVSVTISNDPLSGATLTATATTDANGDAIFQKVRIGGNIVTLSKTGYIPATFVVDFGALGNYYQTVAGSNGSSSNIVALKQSKSVVAPIFSLSSTTGNTATIQGKVTIETDLTNNTPEIPQNLTVKANFNNGLAVPTPSSGVSVLSYSFNSAGIGVATVDNTTGLYSMVVPASAAGYQLGLIFPVITADQKLAIANQNGTPIATGPQYTTVSTIFGPNISYDNSIPNIPGAIAVFPTPPAAGTGVKFTFTPVARTIPSTNLNSPDLITTSSNITYLMTDRGLGYTSSPVITVGNGTASDAQMTASLRGYVTSITPTNAGTGYTGYITANVNYLDATNTPQIINSFLITSVNGGLPSTISLPQISGLTASIPFYTSQNVKGFTVTFSGNGTGAAATLALFSEVDQIQITGGGSYTAAPPIKFTGGGSSHQAAMSITDFGVQYAIGIDNSKSSGYAVMPSNFDLVFPSTSVNVSTIYSYVDVISPNSGILVASNILISNYLTVDGTNINFINAGDKYVTNQFWSLPPTVNITDRPTKQATGVVSVTTDGKVSGLTPGNLGSGYNTAFDVVIQPSAANAPGAGAVIKLTQPGLNPYTKENVWNGGYKINSAGSGYLQQLNMQNLAPVNPGNYGYGFTSGNSTVTAVTGQTIVVNLNYGTGKRSVNVN